MLGQIGSGQPGRQAFPDALRMRKAGQQARQPAALPAPRTQEHKSHVRPLPSEKIFLAPCRGLHAPENGIFSDKKIPDIQKQ